jgi:hypothetical protein
MSSNDYGGAGIGFRMTAWSIPAWNGFIFFCNPLSKPLLKRDLARNFRPPRGRCEALGERTPRTIVRGLLQCNLVSNVAWRHSASALSYLADLSQNFASFSQVCRAVRPRGAGRAGARGPLGRWCVTGNLGRDGTATSGCLPLGRTGVFAPTNALRTLEMRVSLRAQGVRPASIRRVTPDRARAMKRPP